MQPYEPTLSETMEQLRKEGYTDDLKLVTDRLESSEKGFHLFHDDFKVDRYFRFEGMTDPSDETILYAISSDKYHVKGLLVNAYGIYADETAEALIHKLHV